MIRALSAVLLLMLTGVAGAAPSCYPSGLRGESVFRADFFKRTDNGWYLYWYCKKPDGSYSAVYRACRHGACVQQDWLSAQLAIGQAADKAAEADRILAASDIPNFCETAITGNTADAAICRDLTTAMQANWPAGPPPIVYQVVKAAANASPPKTRPMYAWDGVKRGATIVGLRAPEFAPCDCSAGYKEGTSLYCTVPSVNRTDAVTLCERK
jgi:hypothetical protein